MPAANLQSYKVQLQESLSSSKQDNMIDAIQTELNAIDNDNVAVNAAIDPAKIAPGTEAFALQTVGGITGWAALPGGPVSSVPAGAVTAFAGAASPSGWLLCDGTAVDRTTYAALFAAIGTAYGTGNGTTTFNVPDMRGRMPVGLGTNADVAALALNDGSVLADRRPKHTHTKTTSNAINAGAGFASGSAIGISATETIGPAANRPVDAPAYLVLNYIVKT